jgi:hypothetical protein
VRRIAPSLLLLLALAAPAGAQDDGSRAERERVVEETIARLRNPSAVFLRDPDRVRTLVAQLMAARSLRADEVLASILSDTAAHPNVVEQVATAAVLDPDVRLLGPLLERIRVDAGSELDRRLLPLWAKADAELVTRLAAFAADPGRAGPVRRTAVRVLGLTGSAAALDPLLGLWNSPDAQMRDAARAAFEHVLPIGVSTPEAAKAVVEQMRRDDLPLHEVLRRSLAERVRQSSRSPATDAGSREAYLRLAQAMIGQASILQIADFWVAGSPDPEVRAIGARALGEALAALDRPAGASAGPQLSPVLTAGESPERLRRHAARALFDALRREPDARAEEAILRALVAAAGSVRGSVTDDDVRAVAARVGAGTPSSDDRRILAARICAELRDARFAAPLEGTFDALAGASADLRLALLEALQTVPEDRAAWIVPRARTEGDVRVLRRLLSMLARSRSPESVACFRELLGRHGDPGVRADCASALGTQWAASSSQPARDALAEVGLKHADADVRRTAVAALGFPGPGSETLLPVLRGLASDDPDVAVRLASGKAVLDLDEAGGGRSLIALFPAHPELWDLWRERLLEGLASRETTPDRLLEAVEALDVAAQGTLATELLLAAANSREKGWQDATGRGRVRERLVRLLLAQGRPRDAEVWARNLLEGGAKEPELLRRWEILLARSLVNSGEATRCADAETRLLALRKAPELPAAVSAEAAVVLGDARLRLDDATGAVAVLEGDFSAAGDTVRIERDILLEKARTRAAAEKTAVFALVDDLLGADPARAAAAATALRGLARKAAVPLRDALGVVDDAAQIRRLLRAADAVLPQPLPALPEGADPGALGNAVKAAREALLNVPRGSVTGGER